MTDKLNETEAIDEFLTEPPIENDHTPESEVTENTAEPDGEAHDDEKTSITDNDLAELKEEFPELQGMESITELNNPIRYAALRDLGLSPAEAYILTSRKRIGYDNRSHLTTSVPSAARSPRGGMSARELEEARQIFGNISDAEIYRLYKKVTK